MSARPIRPASVGGTEGHDLSDLVGYAWLQSVARHGTDGDGLNSSAATTVLMRLERLQAMEQRAIYFRDFPSQVPYPHPDWSRATLEAAVARSILEDD